MDTQPHLDFVNILTGGFFHNSGQLYCDGLFNIHELWISRERTDYQTNERLQLFTLQLTYAHMQQYTHTHTHRGVIMHLSLIGMLHSHRGLIAVVIFKFYYLQPISCFDIIYITHAHNYRSAHVHFTQQKSCTHNVLSQTHTHTHTQRCPQRQTQTPQWSN